MNKIEKEDLFEYTKKGFLTVGDLKKFIETYKIPDDAPVIVERIHDQIFPEGSKTDGCGVYLKEGDSYNFTKTMNIRMKEEIVRRRNGEPGKFPNVANPADHIVDLGDSLKNQYHPVWGPVFYKDDPDILFLDLHY